MKKYNTHRGMLVLTTKPNEAIIIETSDGKIRLYRNGKRLYIDAPEQIDVYREKK